MDKVFLSHQVDATAPGIAQCLLRLINNCAHCDSLHKGIKLY